MSPFAWLTGTGSDNTVAAGGLHGEQRVPSHPEPWGALPGCSSHSSQVEIPGRWCCNLKHATWTNLEHSFISQSHSNFLPPIHPSVISPEISNSLFHPRFWAHHIVQRCCL